MPHLVLIDGPNYVFRAFHAVKHNLRNSKGEPTNALFGYVQMLRSVLDRLMPTHVAVVFDPQGGTFRHRMYADYKAHRPPMPEELAAQWPRIFELTDAFGFARLCVDDYEADDVIATLATAAQQREGWDVSIVSTDKDLMQLVNDRVWMIDTMRNKEYGPQEVCERWDVDSPQKVHDLLALTGDSADNIPGIPGIGPKTAAQLLRDWGSFDAVLDNAAAIPQKKRRENILAHCADARLSWKLVALERHVPLPLSLDELIPAEADRPRLHALFEQLEFRRLTAEFADDGAVPHGLDAPAAADSDDKHNLRCHCITDEAALTALCQRLQAAELVALDTETTALHVHDAELVGLSLAVAGDEAWYIPVGHVANDDGETPVQLPLTMVLKHLKPLLEDATLAKCGHNLKFDLQVLRRVGIRLAGVVADSMLLAYCLQAGKYPPSLDKLAADFLDYQCTSYEEVVGKGKKQRCFSQVPLDVATAYAGEDAAISWRLTQLLRERLAEHIVRHDRIELPLSQVLAEMEWQGALLNVEALAALSARFSSRIETLEAEIHRLAGESFNIHSPKQLGVILFERLGLPGGKKTKTGQWSTTHAVLEELALQHEVPRLIVEARSLSKLKSTYTDALPRLVHRRTGRVHTSYNQAITSTGRLSSSDPNLQNIPVRGEEGRQIRKAFVAPPGYVLIAADYSQIELRLMAHFSQDAGLLAAFRAGKDIHRSTAAEVHGLDESEVTAELRRQAKAVNFGILYGMSAFGLAKQLGIPRQAAQQFIDQYFARYPGVHSFMDQTLALAREQGWVQTLMGHRVHLPEINSRNAARRSYAERTAINAPLQGSAADIIKVAMIRIQQAMPTLCPELRMILQVHDELVFECPRQLADEVSQRLAEIMNHAAELAVPLEVDIGIGDNWFEAHS